MPNKIYTAKETQIVFSDSGSTNWVLLALQNLGFGAGKVSAVWDRGAGAVPGWYTIRGIFQYETAPQLNEAIEVWMFQGDGTYIDGSHGSGNASLTSAKKVNGVPILFVPADTTSIATDITKCVNDIRIVERYVILGVWNGSSGDNLKNTANASKLIVTPQPDEIQ